MPLQKGIPENASHEMTLPFSRVQPLFHSDDDDTDCLMSSGATPYTAGQLLS